MEEVVSSNLTRSTKPLKYIQPPPWLEVRPWSPTGVQKWTPGHGGQLVLAWRGAVPILICPEFSEALYSYKNLTNPTFGT